MPRHATPRHATPRRGTGYRLPFNVTLFNDVLNDAPRIARMHLLRTRVRTPAEEEGRGEEGDAKRNLPLADTIPSPVMVT